MIERLHGCGALGAVLVVAAGGLVGCGAMESRPDLLATGRQSIGAVASTAAVVAGAAATATGSSPSPGGGAFGMPGFPSQSGFPSQPGSTGSTVASVAALAGAVSQATAAAPAAPADGTVKISFIDLDSFDREVTAAFVSGAREITVDLLPAMSMNQISPRLGRWLNTVQENGGRVQVNGGPRTRNIALIAALGQAAFSAWRELKVRNMVKGINAELMVADERVERVVFKRQ